MGLPTLWPIINSLLLEMNTKIKFFISFGLLVLGLSSCLNHLEEKEQIVQKSELPIHVAAQVDCLSTRVYNDEFQTNDEIGLFVLIQPNSLAGSRYIDNAKLTCQQLSGFTPTDELYYPKGNVLVDFFSYYPYQATGVTKGSEKIDFSIEQDQNLLSHFIKSDFLAAEKLSVIASKNPVELLYSHKLCKLKLYIKPTTGFSLDDVLATHPQIRVEGFAIHGNYSFPNREISAENEQTTILPYGEWRIESGRLVGKEVILIPQSLQPNDQKIIVDAEGFSYSCSFPSEFQLRSETIAELTINFTPSKGISISNTEHKVSPWKEGAKGETNSVEHSVGIPLSQLSFKESNVYNILNAKKEKLFEICKEYLKAENINNQAIVAYPIVNGNTNLREGVVIHVLGSFLPVNLGKASWNLETNQLTYTPGVAKAPSHFYINSDGKMVFEEPASSLPVIYNPNQLEDKRANEVKKYGLTKIGTQYWTRENLASAFFIDHNPINKAVTNTTPSYTTSSFTGTDYFYYSEGVATSAKIAPTNWRLPTDEDWRKLIKYTSKADVLTTGEWLLSPSTITRTNLTGFSVLPNGFIYQGKISEEGKASTYWARGINELTLGKNIYTFQNKLDTVNLGKPIDHILLSIRLVKK